MNWVGRKKNVDLEFMVGKAKVTMKRVVAVGIPLNVISGKVTFSHHALSEIFKGKFRFTMEQATLFSIANKFIH